MKMKMKMKMKMCRLSALMFGVFPVNLVLSCLLLSAVASMPALAAAFGSASALVRGEVVVEALPAKGSARAVKAVGTVRAKPDSVWKALTDYPAFPEYMPNVVESKVQKQEGDNIWVASKFSVTIKNVNYVLKLTHEHQVKPWKITWTRVEGDLNAIDGHYIVQEVPEGTRIEYVSIIDSGSFVPGFIQEALTKRSVPDLFKAVAERAVKIESREIKVN